MNTNIRSLIAGTVAVAALAWAGTASAVTVNIQFTDNRNASDSAQPGRGGGEFSALTTENFVGNYASVATYPGGRFATFCLELSEGISNNGTYNYVLNTAAVNGGVGSLGGIRPDTLSLGTAYLYNLFAIGSLSGYDYLGRDRPAHAGLLQEAIWVLEHELTGPIGANMFLDMATAEFTDLEGAMANYDPTQSRIRVLNLYATRNGDRRQDVLVRVPDAGLTVSLLGLGIMGIAALRRRM